jgi:TfdA family taurine catabolism dioxygenase TauD
MLAQIDAVHQVAPGPIESVLAWRADDLQRDQSWIHRLTDRDIGELEAAATASKTGRAAILDMTKADFPLPLLSTKIASLRRDIMDRFGFGYLRGLPVDRYDRETLMRMFWGLSLHIGDIVPQNVNGHMIGHVIDLGTDVADYSKRVTQTSAGLPFHSDSCDVVGLLCVHTAMVGGESALVSAIAVHNEMMRLSPQLCEALYRPLTVDRRSEIPAGKEPWMRMPVFMWKHGQFTGRAPVEQYLESARRFENAPKTTEQQWEAVRLFFATCNDPAFCLKIPFEPGDLQFVHNHVVFHSRTAFQDWPAPAPKRHLMRVWISLPDGRELHPAMAERWINIERGTVRGGINLPDLKAPTIPMDPLTPAFS